MKVKKIRKNFLFCKILFLFLIFNTSIGLSQEKELKYSKAQISISSYQDLNKLVKNGISVEGIIKEEYIESVFSTDEIETAKKLGYNVNVITPDMQQHYIQNVQNQEILYKETSYDYTQPKNFKLGSMGGFLTYSEVMSELDEMKSKYPDLISSKTPIGDFTTVENRPLHWVKISDNPETDETEPEICFTGLHHAREPASMQQLIFYMWYLLENYSTDNDIKNIVDNSEIYFVPVVNPDGYLYNERTNPNGGGYWRKNRKNNGNGTYGVDLNRNYGYEWKYNSNTSGETYPGPSAFSEEEAQAMKWFVEQHNFVMCINNHTYGELLLYPWGYTSSPCPDKDTYAAISEVMVSENNYANQQASALYYTNGNSDDWMYAGSGHNKIFAFTPEVGKSFWPSTSQIIPICKEMMFHNLTATKAIQNNGEINDQTGSINKLSGHFKYKLKKTGIAKGTFTVSIEAVSNNIANIGNPNTYSDLAIFEETTGNISFTLSNSIQNGDQISYKLILDNGEFTTEQTINKTYTGENNNPEYCSASSEMSYEEWIAEVTIGTETNSSENAEYSDFTSIVFNVTHGNNNITLIPGFARDSYNESWKIWIDLNDDKDFDDSGEEVFSNSGNNVLNGVIAIPSSITGQRRMRVAMRYNRVPTACGTFDYGEVEDYTVNITGDTPVDDEPPTAPANLTISNQTSSSAELNWTASTDNVGVTTYNVYKDNVLETTVTSTSATITGLQTSTRYEFYVRAKDAAENLSEPSNTVIYDQSGPITYCDSKGNNSSYFWINYVGLNNLENTSRDNNGFGDYTNITANISLGANERLYLQTGYNSYAYTVYWAVWIDYNQNGEFESSEKIVNGSTTQSTQVYGDFTVPSDALTGNTRMRITMKYGSEAEPCERFSYGETEDYTINISNNNIKSLTKLNNKASKIGFVENKDIIHPNPANDYLNATINVIPDTQIKIISVNGEIKKTFNAKGNKVRVNISDLSPGLYFLQFDNGIKNKSLKFYTK